MRGEDNKTPLHYACKRGSKNLVQYLVEEVKCDVGTVKFWDIYIATGT